MPSPDNISIVLPSSDADDLISALRDQSIDITTAKSLRQAGGGEFITIILPVALTAVQVAATFVSVYLAARLQRKATQGDSKTEDALESNQLDQRNRLHSPGRPHTSGEPDLTQAGGGS